MSSDKQISSTVSGSGHRVFATTSWSMILEAGDHDSEIASLALEKLCSSYWFPLYAFARRSGNQRSKAEDLTQAFFAEFLEKNRITRADPERGKFRTFLLAAFKNFIKNDYRNSNTQRRGGDDAAISFDFEKADARFQGLATNEQTPDKFFERDWAMSILDATLNSVRQQYEQSDKSELFAALQVYMGGNAEVPYAEIADQLDMRDGAIRVAMHRLRERYGQQLRLQIARTVDQPEDVDQEIQMLFKALGSS